MSSQRVSTTASLPRTRRILVVGDRPEWLPAFESHLEGMEFTTSLAPDCKRAFDPVEQHDVVVCDMALPSDDSPDLCCRAHGGDPRRPVHIIFLTDRDHIADVLPRIERCGGDYALKPVWPEGLLTRIRLGLRLLEHNERIMKLGQQLTESTCVSSMVSLCASVTHELNSPLGAVSFNNRTLERRLSGSPAPEDLEVARQVLQDNRKALEHMAHVTAALRKVYRHGRVLERRLLDVREEIDTALILLSHKIRGRVSVRRDHDGTATQALFNSGDLVQVLVNVIGNALDALQGAGEVRIATGRRSGRPCISVANPAPGVTQEILSRMFEPFFTTKPPGEGVGLGLSICRDIMARNGGSIVTNLMSDGWLEVCLALEEVDHG